MEMPDGNFYDIKIEECPAVVYFDSYGNGHIGTWARENDAKWCLGYVRGDIVEALKAENEELKAKLEKAKAGLRFYGDEEHITTRLSLDKKTTSYESKGKYWAYHDMLFEQGKRARTTLEELK